MFGRAFWKTTIVFVFTCFLTVEIHGKCVRKREKNQSRRSPFDLWFKGFDLSFDLLPSECEPSSSRDFQYSDLFNSNTRDLSWNRLHSSSRWTGPNVCKTSKFSEEYQNRSTTNNIDSFIQSFVSCRNTNTAYICTTIKINDNIKVTNVTILECCLGYGRSSSYATGCTKKIQLKSFEEILVENNATKLLEAVQHLELFEKLNSTKNYTIFAPINEAFDALNTSSEWKDFKNGIEYWDGLSSMIIPERNSRDLLIHGKTVKTLPNDNDDGSLIKIDVYSSMDNGENIVTANCAKITNADHQSTNGYVHFVDRVMPRVTKTLLQRVQEEKRLSTFVSLLNDQQKRIIGDENGRYTMFAFTDEGFEKLPEQTKERIRSKSLCMKNLIDVHILPIMVCGSVFEADLWLKTITGDNLRTKFFHDGSNIDVEIEGKKLLKADLVAKNGVLHIIDGPILLERHQEIWDILNHFGYSTLADYLKNGSITNELVNEENVYVVPPLKTLEAVLNGKNESFVLNFWRDHIGSVSKNTFTSLSGLKSHCRPYLSIGCTYVKDSKTSCGGRLFFTNDVLKMSKDNLLERLKSNEDVSDFLHLISVAGLNDSLTDTFETQTIIAPNNNLLKNLMADNWNYNLRSNPRALNRFLRKYFIKDYICCKEYDWPRSMFNAGRHRSGSERGLSLFSSRLFDRLFFDDQTIVKCDEPANNGLIHVIGLNSA